MHRNIKLLFFTWATFFSLISISLASNAGILMLRWSFPVNIDSTIAPHPLDIVGQLVYFGSSVKTGYTNYLYALNISSGLEIWRYNTSIPINYVTHFRNNNTDYIVAGTSGSTTQPSKSHVIARDTSKNETHWKSTNLSYTITSLTSAKSYLTTGEDVVVGLDTGIGTGTVVRLRGDNGSVVWSYPTTGSVFTVSELKDGSIIVGTREIFPPTGRVYCLNANGTLKWGPFFQDKPLTLLKKFDDFNGDNIPEVIAVFNDYISSNGLIHVLNGTNGAEISPTWPYNNYGDLIKDLLCTVDYTGDGFPDIVMGTEDGNITIVNGRTASRFKGPTSVGYTVSYIQYMYYYENGVAYLNKTLAVSVQEYIPPSSFPYFIRGINMSNLSIMKEYSVPSRAENLLNTSNYTQPYVGDLIFTASNTVYNISGDEIIVPEYSSPIILLILLVTAWLLTTRLRRERPRVH